MAGSNEALIGRLQVGAALDEGDTTGAATLALTDPSLLRGAPSYQKAPLREGVMRTLAGIAASSGAATARAVLDARAEDLAQAKLFTDDELGRLVQTVHALELAEASQEAGVPPNQLRAIEYLALLAVQSPDGVAGQALMKGIESETVFDALMRPITEVAGNLGELLAIQS